MTRLQRANLLTPVYTDMTEPENILGPETVRTRETAMQRFSPEKQQGSGAMLGVVGDAAYSEMVLAPLMRRAQRLLTTVPDPTFRGLYSDDIPEGTREDILALVPEDYHPALAGATSEDELYLMAAQLRGLGDARQRLADMGAGGVVLQLGAAFLDPAAIAVGIGTAGLGPAARAVSSLKTTGRLRTMSRAGLIAAPIDTTLESLRFLDDPDAEFRDLVFAFAASYTLTAGITGIGIAMKRVNVLDAEALVEQRQIAMGAASPFDPALKKPTPKEQVRALLSDRGKKVLDETASPEARRAQLKAIAEAAGVEGEDLDDLLEMATDEGLEWIFKEAMPLDPNLNPDEFTTAGITDESNGWIDRIRFSIGGAAGRAAGRSRNTSFAIRSFVQDILSPTGQSGSVWKTTYLNRMHWRVINESDNLRAAHNAKSKNIEDVLSQEDWNDHLDTIVRGGNRKDNRPVTEEMQKAADLYRTEYGKLREMAQKHGVKGFDQFDNNPNYVPRMFDHRKMRATEEALNRAGKDGHAEVVEMLASSMREYRIARILDEEGIGDAANRAERAQAMRDSDDFGPRSEESDKAVDMEFFRKIADGYYTKVKRLEDNPLSQSAFFGSDEGEHLRFVLEEQYSDILEPDEIDSIIGQATKDSREAGRPARARARGAKFDENYRHTILDDEGNEILSFGFSDLLDNNIMEVTRRYASGMLGEMVSARTRQSLYVRMNPTDIDEATGQPKNFTSRKQMLEALQKDGASADDLRLIEWLDDATRDKLAPPKTPAGRRFRTVASMARLANMARIGGTFGLAQIPEIVGTITEVGFRAAIKQMPTFEGFLEAARTGRATNPMARDIQNFIGSGADAWTHTLGSHTGAGFEGVESAAGRLEKLLRSAADITARASGLKYIDTVGRTWAARAGIQNVVDAALAETAAKSARRISDRKLASLGMTRPQWERVARAVRAEVEAKRGLVTEKGSWGVTAKRFDPGQWADQDAANMLIAGIDRWSSRSIQRNDIGSMSQWMTNDAAKVLLQFQTFHLNAYDQQLMFAAKYMGPAAASRFITTSFAGAAVWSGQHYVRSRLQDDPQEYRDEHLSLGRIVSAGVQRGGMTSLAPQLFDFTAHFAGQDPVFDARNSGLSSVFLDLNANPTFQGIADAVRVPGSLVQAATGQDDFSEGDAARALRLAPFRTLPGIKQLGDAFVESFEEEKR